MDGADYTMFAADREKIVQTRKLLLSFLQKGIVLTSSLCIMDNNGEYNKAAAAPRLLWASTRTQVSHDCNRIIKNGAGHSVVSYI